MAAVDAIRAAMTTYVLDLDGEELPDLVALDAVLTEINTLCQAGHYDRAGALLPLAVRHGRPSGPTLSRTALRDSPLLGT